MSDSDDTDVLLLIPPDLFLVPSSDSEDQSDSCNWQQRKSGVVSELIDHMQTLESRISAIESKDSPNNTLNLSRQLSLDSIMSSRQTIPRTKFSVSRHSSLQSTPTKPPQCFSLPPTPNIHQKSNYTIEKHHHPNSNGNYQSYKRDPNFLKKYDHSKSFSESHHLQHASQIKSALNAGVGSPGKESCILLSPALNVCENNISCHTYKPPLTGHYGSDHKSVKDMSLPETDKFLKEIQSNDKDKISKSHNSNGNLKQIDTGSPDKKVCEMRNNDECTNIGMDQEQNFIPNNHNTLCATSNSFKCIKRKDHLDCSLLDSSFSSFDTDRFMTEFKTWNLNFSQDMDCSKTTKIDLRDFEDNEDIINKKQKEMSKERLYNIERHDFPATFAHHAENKKETDQQINTNFYPTCTDASIEYQMLPISSSKSCPTIFKTPSNFPLSESLAESAGLASNIIGNSNCLQKNSTIDTNENQSSSKRPQRLLTLSDIWDQDSCKPEEEQLRLRLEEEKFRREHCEQLIQELQKKLLEHQEKIAVAIRVDNEKNSFISQFQVSWKKMKQKLFELETKRESLQNILKGISEKHQLEIIEYQKQILKYKEELSKAINLATGYKEKSDALVAEKVELLKNHADELKNYQTLVQQSDKRYEEMKDECQKLLEKNKNTDETLKGVQQNLNMELMKSSEVRAELSVIHKALDACETELIILRQEKDNLQIMLKEENNRNNILEKGKNSLVTMVDEAKKAEKLAKNEVKSLTEQQEKLRAELRDVYQKQVDEVVKTKLHEFQTQLDSAEAVFQNEVETKQRAIAECAARKIKSVMDKHQLEIHLIEEKHKEEKKLFEIKIAQAVQKSAIFEAQLNSYRKSKSQLVEQLYSMLQRQWQQALVIISGGNGESLASFQKINVDKLLDFPIEENLELIPEHCSTLCIDPIKSVEQKSINVKSSQAQDVQHESSITLASNNESALSSTKESKSDLKKYIKMILDMQQKDEYQRSNVVNDCAPSSQREMSCKQSSLGKNRNVESDGNTKWEPLSEVSIHDTSEYLSPPQKFAFQNDHTKEKPQWK